MPAFIFPPLLFAKWEVASQGEINSWIESSEGDQSNKNTGIRYLPMIKLAYPLSDDFGIDAEITGNFYATWQNHDGGDVQMDHDEKAYRLWTRIFSDQLEVRLGLQEVSFGPGKILRSLRWFDQKDSRDPTNFTDGVKGLLMRYYYEDNTNIWGWALTGNENAMGISPLKTGKNELEWGGRIQIPLGSTELGVAIHQRKVDIREFLKISNPNDLMATEQRIGMDMFWNLGVGVYFESTFLKLDKNDFLPEEQTFVTLGCDYTFDYGDGISSILEIMGIHLDFDQENSLDTTVWLASLSEQMPLNLLDQIQVLVYRAFGSDITSLNASWKRTYDDFILNAVLYYTAAPNTGSVSNVQQYSFPELSGGKGLRLLVQFNY